MSVIRHLLAWLPLYKVHFYFIEPFKALAYKYSLLTRPRNTQFILFVLSTVSDQSIQLQETKRERSVGLNFRLEGKRDNGLHTCHLFPSCRFPPRDRLCLYFLLSTIYPLSVCLNSMQSSMMCSPSCALSRLRSLFRFNMGEKIPCPLWPRGCLLRTASEYAQMRYILTLHNLVNIETREMSQSTPSIISVEY